MYQFSFQSDVHTQMTSSIPRDHPEDFTPIYSNKPQTITWNKGDNTDKTVTVDIINDNECEPTESFDVFVTNPDGGVLGTQTCSLVSIIDNDGRSNKEVT